MRNDKAEKDSTGRIKPGKTAPYVKKGYGKQAGFMVY